VLPVVVWIKFSIAVGSETFSAVLPDSPFGNLAQSGTHQTVREVRLDEDIDNSGDSGSVHFGEKINSV